MDKVIAFNKAKQIFYDYKRTTAWGIDFDHWISISEDWDLNMWSDEEGVLHATLYPVVNGNTISIAPYTINDWRINRL